MPLPHYSYQMHECLPLAIDAAARASGFDVLHLSLARGGLLGGKGGFGAMLRSMVRGFGWRKKGTSSHSQDDWVGPLTLLDCM